MDNPNNEFPHKPAAQKHTATKEISATSAENQQLSCKSCKYADTANYKGDSYS